MSSAKHNSNPPVLQNKSWVPGAFNKWQEKQANIVLYTLFRQALTSGIFYKALLEAIESADIAVLKLYPKLEVCLAALSE